MTRTRLWFALYIVATSVLVVYRTQAESLQTAPRDDGTHAAVSTFSVREQPVRQVLLAFAEQAEISIVTDATVDGTVSLVLHDTTPTGIIEAVAAAAGLFVEERRGVVWISRVRFDREGPHGWSLQTSRAPLSAVVAEVGRRTNTPIVLAESSPHRVTVSTTSSSVLGLIETVAAHAGLVVQRSRDGYVLATEGEAWNVTQNGISGFDDGAIADGRSGSDSVEIGSDTDGTVHLRAESTSTDALLHAVADAEEIILISTVPLDRRVDAVELVAPSFSDLHNRLSAMLGLSITREESVLFVEDVHRDTAASALHRHAVFAVAPLSATDARELLASVEGIAVDWIDEPGFRVAVTGLPSAITAGRRLLESVAAAPSGGRSLAYRCRHLTAAGLRDALAERYPEIQFRADMTTNRVVAALPAGEYDSILATAEAIDAERRSFRYRCTYIEPDIARERVATLFPNFSGVTGSDTRTVVFSGPPVLHEEVRRLLNDIDRTADQIRFDLCIIQYEHSDSRRHGIEFTAEKDNGVSAFTAPFAVKAAYDRMTSIRFDFFSALGYRAALGISEELSNNTARLVVDTSLSATEGRTARLENAATFRYRDVLGDEESDGYRAVTREIDSGLTVELTGRTRADRTIAVDIAVTLSKNGTDMTGNDNPPPTSRKLVETTLYAEVGKPIVIGGLLQREARRGEYRFPLLGRIPLVRKLVNSTTRRMEETELVLYLTAYPQSTQSDRFRTASQIESLEQMLEEQR